MVLLPIMKSTGLSPLRVDPGAGLAIRALLILSGVLSTTWFTSSSGLAVWAKVITDIVIDSAIVVINFSIIMSSFSFSPAKLGKRSDMTK